MKVIKLLIVVIFLEFFSCKILEISENERDLRVEVVDYIIDNIFIKKFQSSTINLVSSPTDEESKFVTSEIVDQLVRELDSDHDEVAVTIETIGHSECTKSSRKIYFSVFFIDSYKGLYLILSKVDSDKYELNGGYVILLTKEIESEYELKKIFENLWSHYIVNVIVIVKKLDENFISIYTYFPFAPGKKCENSDPTLLTTYDSINGFKDKKVNLTPRKTSNFYGCPLSMATYNYPPFIMIDEDKEDNIEGIEGALIKEFLRDKLNFTLVLEILSDNSWASIDDKGRGGGVAGMVMGNKVNFTAGFVAVTPHRNKYMSPSNTYYTTNLVWMITPGEIISAVERMKNVFDRKTWMMILLIYVISIIVIFIIKCQSDVVKDFVFGRNNRSPFMTMLVVANGLVLTRLPGRNFARYLLMVFMLYGMVIRSAYTGTWFKFLKEELRINDPKDMDELISRNYSFFAIEELRFLINPSQSATKLQKDIAEKVVFLDARLFKRFREIYISKGNSKAALLSEDQVAYYNQNAKKNTKNYKKSFLHILPEVYMSVNLCIYFQKNSCLPSEFNRQIMNLNSNGLIGGAKNYFANRIYLKKPPQEIEPKKFGFNEVNGGFAFYIFGISIAIIVFFLEILYEKFKEKEKISVKLRRQQRNDVESDLHEI